MRTVREDCDKASAREQIATDAVSDADRELAEMREVLSASHDKVRILAAERDDLSTRLTNLQNAVAALTTAYGGAH